MSPELDRPYLIIPHFVEQPTWGGSYIVSYKQIADEELKLRKIGQSYELYGGSILSLSSSSADSQFQNDIVEYNKSGSLSSDSDYVTLQNLTDQNPSRVLGSSFPHTRMPLLIKFTQALGNSFQIHVKKSQKQSRWKPKPESWYYLEDGVITYGVKKGADMDEFKQACLAIEEKMIALSDSLTIGALSYGRAKEKAESFIKSVNPWRFVNTHRVKRHSIVDLSPGAVQHSWEEDPVSCPHGNVLYEVQLDVTDDESTIRAFDKGKIQPDGTIRKIHVEDYFAHIDTDPEHNDLSLAMRKREGHSLIHTSHYSLDAATIQKEAVVENPPSFVHIFVIEGELRVETPTRTLSVEKGYSCFIPRAVKTFALSPTQEKTSILKTYIK
jgi:mannose-6-phosphate isomerase class I